MLDDQGDQIWNKFFKPGFEKENELVATSLKFEENKVFTDVRMR